MSRPAALATALALLLALTGCEHHFFKASGTLASDGGELGAWSSTPEGCARDPLDGLPPQQSRTIATFLWKDPTLRDKDRKRETLAAPLQLELSRSSAGPVATLETLNAAAGARLDSSDCSQLALSLHDGKPAIPGGRPTLAGTLALDCQVSGSHLTAHLQFSGCEY